MSRPARGALTRTALGCAVLAALTAASGCGGQAGGAGPELAVSGAFVPEPVGEEMAAGFLTIENTGETDDTLTGISSDAAATVEMHETTDGAMRAVPSLPVPAGGELRLSRGGDHLMLLGLTRALTEGDTLSFELRFESSEPITLDVPVEAATHTGE